MTKAVQVRPEFFSNRFEFFTESSPCAADCGTPKPDALSHPCSVHSCIRNQILPLEAEFLQNTAYGALWRIRGTLKGPNGVTIRVVTIWMHEKYRGMTKFITLFPDNDLVVATLVLIMLVFEAPDLRVADEYREYLAGLKKRIPQAYVQSLRDLGVEARHLQDWEKLIVMRYEEYARDRHDVRAAAMEVESKERSLNMDTLSKIQMLLPVQAVAIGCHHHICRGETAGKDNLFKLVLESLSRFYFEFRIKIEGAKITPFARAHLAVKRSLDRIRTKKGD